MANSAKGEFHEWVMLFTGIVLEFAFLAAWIMLAWVIDEYIQTKFPLHENQMTMVRLLALIFDLSTLYKLLKFFYLREKRTARRSYPWWM